jgi:hypothetical protein
MQTSPQAPIASVLQNANCTTLDVTAGEVAAAKSTAKLGKVAHPDDGVVPEALVYGGPMLDRALAAIFTIVLRTGVVPADWRTGAMRCVYKKGDTCVFKNYRGVVCGSHATGIGDGRDADVDERRPPRADGDGCASDDSDSESDGEDRPDAGAAQRAWNADVRRRCVALVKTREAALFAKKKPPRDTEFEVKSAALWRAPYR